MADLATLELQRVGKRFFVCSHEGGQLLGCVRRNVSAERMGATYFYEVFSIFRVHLGGSLWRLSIHLGGPT